MLVDLTVLPLRGGRHISDEVAEVIKLIDASGLPYQFTPSGTCIEGEWETVMPLVQRCHNMVRSLMSLAQGRHRIAISGQCATFTIDPSHSLLLSWMDGCNDDARNVRLARLFALPSCNTIAPRYSVLPSSSRP